MRDIREDTGLNIYLVKFGLYYSSDVIFYRGYNFEKDAKKFLKEAGFKYLSKEKVWLNENKRMWAKIVPIPFVVC